MRNAIATGALLAGVFVVAACSDDGGDTASTDTGVDGAEVDGRWTSLLTLVPDDAATRAWVTMSDPAGAAEALGIDRPDAEASSDDVAAYLSEVYSASPEDGGNLLAPSWMTQGAGDDEQYRAEMGYSLAQVDRTIEAGEPPDVYVGLLGSFDPDAAAEVLADVPHWGEIQEEVEYGGTTYIRWGDDNEIDGEHTSAARPLGIGGRMVIDDDSVLFARSDAAIEAMIDARSGDGSLAGDDDYAALADALEDQPVYSVVLTDDVPAADSDDDAPALVDVEAWGTAWGVSDDGEITTVVVLLSGDADAAEQNAELFTERIETGQSASSRQPFSDVAEVTDSTVDGRVTIIQLETDVPQFAYRGLLSRDGLVVTD